VTKSLKNPLSQKQLKQRLLDLGKERYHNNHVFHKLLHNGKLTKGQVQAWVLNRYCYQASIPIKDSAIMMRIEDSDLRRQWRQRLIDHDGDKEGKGGIAGWLKLAEGVGLNTKYVMSYEGALPATKFAVGAYIHFVSENSLLEAIASSLTEMFAPTIIEERVEGMLKHYDYINEDTLIYFKPRLTQAPRDVDMALNYVLAYAITYEQQMNVLHALQFKCDVLWSQLDALYFSYIEPGLIPPGCFNPMKIEAL